MSLRRAYKEFLADERGQSTTEYILILSVVVMLAMQFKKVFEPKLKKLLQVLDGQMTEAVQDTGP